MTVVINMHNIHVHIRVMSVLCTPLQVKCILGNRIYK